VRAANVELREGGYVGGNVDVSPDGSADIDGRVAGSVVAKNITLGPQAVIGGSIVHLGGSLSISPTAGYSAVSSTPTAQSDNRSRSGYTDDYDTGLHYSYNYGNGNETPLRDLTLFSTSPFFVRVPVDNVRRMSDYIAPLLLWLGFLVGTICLPALALAFFHRTVTETVTITENEPVRALLVGLLGLILLPVTMAVAVVTIVGIPLLPAIAITFILAIAVGFIGEGVFLGRKMGRLLTATWGEDDFKAGILGLFALLHLVFVPVVGWAIMVILGLLGYGGVLIQWYPIWRARWRQRGGRSAAGAGDTGGGQ